MYLEELKNIVQNNLLSSVYVTGIVLSSERENELAEFVPYRSYLFFEFGDQLVKIEAIEQYSKISIALTPTFIVRVEVEDVIPAKSNISDIILDNSLIDNKVSQIELLNMEVKSNEIICDALKLSITNNTNKQELFLDPQFFGINIGGFGVEELWKYNQLEEYKSISTIIEF
ncbi:MULTISPECIES: hypothetical protein [Paenibacillus]|uniref:Uncharacterized protein n=1 Tax=Paenibacillus amylolyticus TaxID=1451 RepID=A0A117I1X0_PAEAM|nr:hypothetical protein [Paenibacillus amylolyticus]GAS82865.1 unknown protein [Paenibacillus amylolyticus]